MVTTDRHNGTAHNRAKESTEEYYRRVKGLECASQVFEGTAEPEDVLLWAQRYEHYLETGLNLDD